jgi:tetratricopeptide (TPR) repeat protein
MLSRDPSAPPVRREPLLGCDHDIRAFNIDPGRNASEPQHGTYTQIAALFPDGWRPDVFLHWSLEYNPAPIGIEEADCLTVATIGDWNLGGQAVQIVGGAFDLLIADRNGCARLRKAGFENVLYVPLWGYDPNLHRPLPEVERDLDIVMVGNFNHEVQRERSRWLARVAKLSQYYRICLTSNVYGEEYVHLLNRARIVFNRSIRGEINMRVYESLACGALLFNESDNAEIGDLLTDRVHCVLYDEQNLEQLLEYYLTHPEERESIARAGNEKIAPYTYEHIYRRIYAEVEAFLGKRGKRESADYADYTDYKSDSSQSNIQNRDERGRSRQFAFLTPAERKLRYARQRLTMPHRYGLIDVAETLAQGRQHESDSGEAGEIRACALAEWALGLPDTTQRRRQLQAAIACAHSALRQSPDRITLHFNLAQMYLALDRTVAAMSELQKTLQRLDQADVQPEMLCGPLFPRRYDGFLVELEALYTAHQPGSEEWATALALLLRRRALELCSDLALRSRHHKEALAYAEAAVALNPGCGINRRRLARVLRALGRATEAEIHYRRALKDIPLDPEIWSELATLLQEQERVEDCWTFLEEVKLLLDGCPAYDFWRPTLRALLSRLSLGRARIPEQPVSPSIIR